jgi:hypothetical protein
MKLLKIAFLFLAFTSSLNCSAQRAAQVGEWRFIASKTVDYALDKDVIPFDNVQDNFSQLKFKITDASLRMFDVKVHFDNGDFQDVSLRKTFRRGEESRVIDLTGGTRHLSKIDFWYKTRGLKGKARIEVWGK